MTAVESERVRISDIAEELGLSTATVSNVLHGKRKRVSDETIKRVQELVEKSGYIPSMAGILLAQNDSGIIGVVINDHEKYEGHVLEDGFISSSLSALSREIDVAGYFMMVKTVVYEGFFQELKGIGNVTIDNYDGGCQVGRYLKSMGHSKVLCISDSFTGMDSERMDGCSDAMGAETVSFMKISVQREERMKLYREREPELLEYTAIFAMSDFYAVELIHYLRGKGVLCQRISRWWDLMIALSAIIVFRPLPL